MQLNRYIASSGLCSRRKADLLIKNGEITVNDEIIKDSSYKVKLTDIVQHKGNILKPQKKIYILLNKPKGYITTVSDERGRKTVFDLVSNKIKARLYPVGRLDRATTGLLILTNDGDLAQKLSHPSFEVQKTYTVTLDKPLTQMDFSKIVNGLKLEDGFVKPDYIRYLESKDKLLIILHSGKNRIVRRIFERLGYKIKALDRSNYAGLTKKNLLRGNWRFLSESEICKLQKFDKEDD